MCWESLSKSRLVSGPQFAHLWCGPKVLPLQGCVKIRRTTEKAPSQGRTLDIGAS